MIRGRRGFTLIEMTLAVLLMALLASAVAMSFSQPLRAARSQDAIAQLHAFDVTARQAAIASGANDRLVFDLSAGTLARMDGPALENLRSRSALPPGFRIAQIQIAQKSISIGEAQVDISPSGWSRSYSLRLQGPGFDQWLVFAGLTGEMMQVHDEAAITTPPDTQRHNTY